MDVEFDLGRRSEHPELAGYELSHYKDGHYYSLVTLNSDYRDHYPDTIYSYVDFMSLVPAGYDLSQFLKYIGVQQTTTTSVGSMIGKNAYTAYDSTYRLFLHELGHAFGLGDLYRSQLHVNCDPEYMVPAINKRQPKAIMNDSSFFYLTRDDELGTESLFERFNSVADSFGPFIAKS